MKNFTIVLVLMTLLFTSIAIAADDSQSISDLSPLIDDSAVKLGKSTYSDVEL